VTRAILVFFAGVAVLLCATTQTNAGQPEI